MIIPLSSQRVRRHQHPPTRHGAASSRIPYVGTALAYQLLADDDGDGKMGFLEHLDELRKRLIRCCIGVAVGMLIAFLFIDRIVNRLLPVFTCEKNNRE